MQPSTDPTRDGPAVSGEAIFLAQLALIDRVIAFVCRRNHLNATDAEDFASHARLRLMDDGYAVLRKFQGRSSLKTFLTITLQRVFYDYRIAAWGKWRPSAEAGRRGAVAILLERLIGRDGHTVEEAFEIITVNHRVDVSRADLERMAAALPPRTRRRMEQEDILEGLPSGDAADEAAIEDERRGAAARIALALEALLGSLPAQDRLILRLRFEDGRTVSQMAAILRLGRSRCTPARAAAARSAHRLGRLRRQPRGGQGTVGRSPHRGARRRVWRGNRRRPSVYLTRSRTVAVEHPHDPSAAGSGCPDAEDLAAYLEGTLDPASREAVEAHLADCARCRAALAETTSFIEEETPAAAPIDAPRVVPFRRPAWRAPVTAALTAAAALFLVARLAPQWFPWGGEQPELQELMAALAKEPARPVEGRLAGGFAYAPPPPVTRGSSTREMSPEVRFAAGNLQSRAATDARGREAQGPAHLVSGDAAGAAPRPRPRRRG